MKALLFDLDGTLIHSMPLHHQAWAAWFAHQGLPFDGQGFFERTAGRSNAEILAALMPQRTPAEREAMADVKEALYQALVPEHLQAVDGAMRFLAEAKAAGVAMAVCTAAPPGNIAVAFEKFGLGDFMQTVTSPADGLRGKPHPDIFVEAARRLGVPAGQCLVFEDAPLGIEAARRGGMRAVALTTTLPASAFEAYPNLVGAAPHFGALQLQPLLEILHA